MLELDPLPTLETEHQRDVLEQTVKHLFERSLQLQEYSRSLRERSQELNQRVRVLLNSGSDV